MFFSVYRRLPGFLGAIVICAAIELCASAPASASVFVVTPPGTTNCKSGIVYNTIKAAITAAETSTQTNPTIFICPGTYAEQLSIDKSLTLTGLSKTGTTGTTASGANNPLIVTPTGGVVVNATRLNGESTAAQIAVVSPSASPITVNINNLAIDGSNNQLSGCGTQFMGIYYQNANGTVNHVATRYQELDTADFGCQTGLGIFAEGGLSGTTAKVTVENSSVHDYQKNGITAHGSTTLVASGNYVVGVGPTNQIGQNGIEIAFGATGTVSNNTVTDDIYINNPNCCFSASGILVYESGGVSSTSPLTISGNTVSNTQGAVVLFGDTTTAADYVSVMLNKITTSPAIPGFQIDGIDMCGNNDSAKSNTIFNSSGSGVHIDSSCTETSGATGNGATVMNNIVNEACAGVLLGTATSGNTVSGNSTYNVVQASYQGDSCPSGSPAAKKARLKPNPFR